MFEQICVQGKVLERGVSDYSLQFPKREAYFILVAGHKSTAKGE